MMNMTKARKVRTALILLVVTVTLLFCMVFRDIIRSALVLLLGTSGITLWIVLNTLGYIFCVIAIVNMLKEVLS